MIEWLYTGQCHQFTEAAHSDNIDEAWKLAAVLDFARFCAVNSLAEPLRSALVFLLTKSLRVDTIHVIIERLTAMRFNEDDKNLSALITNTLRACKLYLF